MKTNLFQLSLLFLLCTSVLCGCANDDEQLLSTDGSTLTVHATAEGFASADGVNTRASESGYTTTFTNGDQIGVFAVKDGNVIEDCKNVPLTYNGTNWEGTVYYYTGAKYFAYYPYDASMHSKTSVDEIVTAFNPQTDQSTYANYTKSDLMTADVVSPSDDKTLRFSFAHKMSLIEISLPVQKYITPDPDKYEYSYPVIGATFSIAYGGYALKSITPYNMGGGVYRYIVPVRVSPYKVGGEFQTSDDKTIEYKKEEISLNAGSYKRLNVSYEGAPSGEPLERALAIGDFYYSDGGIVPRDAPNPPSKDRIGIVMKVGRDNGDTDWTDDCKYKLKDGETDMNTVHGYVLALYDANDGGECTWGSFGTQVEYEGMMNRDQNTGFYGYKNTQAVILFAKKNNLILKDAFPAVYWGTDGYEDSHPAPENSSGWFLPSAGQCTYWLNNRNELLKSVNKVTGNDSYEWKDSYWSSSEYSFSPAISACYAYFFSDYMGQAPKSENLSVRACLAF
ncbi:fimbrillin family protein [Bacteroides hominis]|uniref:fimbrillin family protein n=1 Tax=Bacteroides hominis TaxID=2763023 RepID=UPI00164A87B1|nr:fimbrillin family protein [Bacteroides hominis (ex Liu et al. 2022)]MBC5612757.1 fimbrillin family protein [Bacteroides hominis (ex Liu et al. 2022)]MCS2833226.1 fimbrillin family protein [Bacteroides fragilis]